MDIQELENAVALLIEEMEGDFGDSHEIYMRLQQTLASMRAMGMPLPDDLVRMEKELSAEFEADAKRADPGRRRGKPANSTGRVRQRGTTKTPRRTC